MGSFQTHFRTKRRAKARQSRHSVRIWRAARRLRAALTCARLEALTARVNSSRFSKWNGELRRRVSAFAQLTRPVLRLCAAVDSSAAARREPGHGRRGAARVTEGGAGLAGGRRPPEETTDRRITGDVFTAQRPRHDWSPERSPPPRTPARSAAKTVAPNSAADLRRTAPVRDSNRRICVWYVSAPFWLFGNVFHRRFYKNVILYTC